MKKLLVVDGNSILNRAFYGIRLLTNKDGLYTNAVYGMVTILSRHIEALKPDYCAVAFDLKAPTFRHKMYDLYKANRTGMPEELAVQLPYAKECMSALGFSVLSLEGYEADDILGTLSAQANEEGIEAYILTGDRDSLQLISDNTTVLLVKTKETLSVTEKEFGEMYGIHSSQFVDVKALMGDSSDNIPGVAGIGEKTALKLISEFGSLEKLYEDYEGAKLSPSVKQKLTDGKEKAFLSQKLARIDRSVPLETSMENYAYNGVKKRELRDLFVKLEFNALISKFGLSDIDTDNSQNNAPAAEKTVIKEEVLSVEQIQSRFSGKKAAVTLNGEKLSLCDGETLASIDISQENAKIVENLLSSIELVTFDCKKLYKDIEAFGIHIRSCAFDCMLAAYVLDSNRTGAKLSELLVRYLGVTADADSFECSHIFALGKKLEEEILADGQEKLLYEIEIPLAAVLADMELTGFRIDVDGITRYGEVLKETADALQSRIYSYAGEEFNISSPKQLGEVLFEKMALPKSKKTKTGYSTDAETLQKLIPYHPIIEDILDYRQMTKLKSTYADGLAKAADAEGRVHSAFNQTGTATGRLSSSEPNLQNIPVRTEAGREFRRYFIPKNDDYVIIDADYSQIELRLLAHISGDDTMIESYREGVDIHTMTASKVFGVEPTQVTPELRKRAKAVNFGIIYGIGEYSLSEDLGISRAQAKRYIDSYLEGFPKVREYLDAIKKTAKDNGYVTTYFGRKRYIPELSSSNKNLQHFGERVAMNSPIQGTAADIIKIAMIDVDREIKKSGIDARLLLQVHDELLIEAHKDCAKKALGILKECMENAVSLSIPLEAEANFGNTWYEAK
ncbi:MAG: DNA polymerase I [Ruminococcaceae bacterium]|nr:DNA polymerase I [Oscillospiraceae bacterium]